MTATKTAKVTIGQTFRYVHADSQPLWRVEKARGGNAFECVVISEDWTGTRKVFGGEEILRSQQASAFWNEMHDTHDGWWAARKIGEIVHYSYGFGQYVRGRIVWDVSEKFPEGRNAMVPTDLVGNWQDYHLPHFNAAGRLVESLHVRQIRDETPMQPNYSNMVEAVGVREGKGDDPRGKPAIDLTPPKITPEQQKASRLSAIHEQVQALLNVEHDPERAYSETLLEALLNARTVLNALLLE